MGQKIFHGQGHLDFELQKLESLAQIMDNQFVIPGTSIKFGLDSLIGMIPVAGDTATLLITMYIVQKSKQFNLPWHLKAQMIGNSFIDWIIGLVPLAGDLFDVKWKANLRNVAIIKKHVSRLT